MCRSRIVYKTYTRRSPVRCAAALRSGFFISAARRCLAHWRHNCGSAVRLCPRVTEFLCEVDRHFRIEMMLRSDPSRSRGGSLQVARFWVLHHFLQCSLEVYAAESALFSVRFLAPLREKKCKDLTALALVIFASHL